jgi:caspase domain-containing protein
MTGSPGTLPAPDLPTGRRLALVIATTRYADTSLRQLRAPARDAADLRDLLADPQIGGFTVTSVVDSTAQGVRSAVEEFLTGRDPGDLLLVYLSCHGLVDLRRRLYFSATDTLKDRLASTGVEAEWLLDQLEDCRARQQVVILDCCFSGAFAKGAKADTDLALGERFHGQGRGRVVLTASRASEYSFEGDPVPGSAMPGSVFTNALVAGLRTGAADGNHDGYISVDEAYAYAFDQIRAADAKQTPQRWLYGAEGTILLARSPAGITMPPAALPEAWRGALDSSHPAIRLGAVTALGEWLAADDPARELAARNALQQVADTDVPRVAEAARALLEAGPPPGENAGGDLSAVAGTRAETTPIARSDHLAWLGRPRRRRLLYAAGAAVVLAAGAATALPILNRGDSPGDARHPASNEITAPSSWRLEISKIGAGDNGCTVTVTNTDTGDQRVFENIWGTQTFQMQTAGTFRWEANEAGCRVVKRSGQGKAVLPFSHPADTGDTAVFAAPKAPGSVSVQVRAFNSYGRCDFELHDAADGQLVDLGTVPQGKGPLRLDPNGRPQVYLANVVGCDIRVSAVP